ncbi:MAG: polysaccharide deacetylase family protein [Erysipelothrix sp.]|nr:polysaccharide deacetylase family protein [Erysipelothrix sp.]
MASKLQKRKLKKGAALVIGLIAVVILFLIGKSVLSLFNLNKEFAITEASEQLVLEDYSKLDIQVEYTNDKKVNTLIDSEIQKLLETKKDLFLNKEKSLKVEAEYAPKYQLLSYRLVDGEANLNDLHGNFLIDLKTRDTINTSELYSENLEGLSMLVRKYLALDPELKYNKNTYTKTLPQADSFKNIGFSDEEFIVYYNNDELKRAQYSQAKIPIYEAINYFNDELMSRIDKDFVREEVNVRYIDPNKPMMAVTFDDGPLDRTSLAVAKYFESKGQRLTFFWLGTRIETSKELVKEIYDAGHEIANHSNDHANFNLLSADELKAQTSGINDLIKSITNQESVLIRPPYGAANASVREAIDSPLILWTVDTLDWSSRDEDSVYNHMVETTNDGNIILLHDLYETSTKAAMRYLDANISKYQFVTVSELHAYSGQPLVNGEFTTGVKR